jgi:hypothetical protein
MKKIILILIIFITQYTMAQNPWQRAVKASNMGYSYSSRLLFCDSINDELIVSGGFGVIDSVYCYGAFSFNGNRVKNIKDTLLPIPPLVSFWNFGEFQAFQNKLFFSSSFGSVQNMEGDSCHPYFCYLENNQWKSPSFQPFDNSQCMFVYHNKLVVSDYFEKSSPNRQYALHVFDEQSQAATSLKINYRPNYFSGTFYCAKEYKGKVLLGGNFNLGTPNPDKALIFWDGDTTFFMEGGGVKGFAATIQDMEIYQDTLYVGGYFFQADGNASDFIMKWDGENWHPGPQVNGTIWDIDSYKGILTITGLFTQVSGIAAKEVAYYDGYNWHDVGITSCNDNFIDTQFYKDTLYAAGHFRVVNGDSMSVLIKYTGNIPIGLEKSATKKISEIGIFPNPANDEIFLSGVELSASCQIFGSDGRLINESPLTEGGKLKIEFLSQGIYVLKVLEKNNIRIGRFIKSPD